MLKFQFFPINFRSVYQAELDKAIFIMDNFINKMQEIEDFIYTDNPKYGELFELKMENQEVIIARQEHPVKSKSLFRSLETSNIVKNYLSANKLDLTYNTIDKYRFILESYISDCRFLLNEMEIPSILNELDINYIKVLSNRSISLSNYDRDFNYSFIMIEFTHSKTGQSYSMKMPRNIMHKDGTHYSLSYEPESFWQIRCANNDIIEILKSDINAYNKNS